MPNRSGGNSGSGGGSSTGGGPGSGGGSSTGGGNVGDECQGDGDCNSNICLFKSGSAFGYCSKICSSFTDCPDFWNCEEVGNASGTYCVQ